MDVDGISIAKALEIENASIIEGEVNAAGNLVLKNKGGTEFNAGSVVRPPQVDVFLIDGQWTKPVGAVRVHFVVIGDGGGGSGAKETGGAGASGSGGGGGGFNEDWVDADALPDTIDVVVGQGGPGGTAGNNGSNGEGTYFEGVVRAPGGFGGVTEDGGAGSGSGGGPPGNVFAGEGADGAVSFATPSAPAPGTRGGGGGGGGTYAAAPAAQQGGSPGSAGGGERGVVDADRYVSGPGGQGGDSQVASPYALPGDPGGLYGGGGGGGAASSGPAAYAAGGPGGPGLAVATTYF